MGISKRGAFLKRSEPAWAPIRSARLLKAANDLPCDWASTKTELGFRFLRCRLRFTQDELAAKSGLAQSLVSRLEGGFDARLSTRRRVYAAMGFELLLVPVSSLSVEELERRAEEGRPPGHWARERARPRRRSVT